jgi:RNA polymerase sigma-70 factor (ECF subfamily)
MRNSKVDRETFEGIVREYDRKIFNAVYRLVDNYEDAMDITQTVFLKAYEKFNLYDPSYKLFSWLYKIAINESINHVKSRKRTVQLDPRLVSQEKNPEENVLQKKLVDRLQEALRTLKLDYRIVVVMKYFLELSYNDISDMLDIPVKTVKSRLFTARALLRNILVKQG